MAVQTSLSSQTANIQQAQRTIIGQMRYTSEHNAPAMGLITHIRLERGSRAVDIPKAGQVTIDDLVEGEEITNEQELGLGFVTLTTSEVGAVAVITDPLLRQMQVDVFKVMGKQLGDGMARKKDNDTTALYTNLNNGVTLGQAGKTFSIGNMAAAYTFAIANNFGSKLYVVHHPNTLFDIINSGAVTAAAEYPVSVGWSRDLLEKFFVALSPIGGVPMFHDGNITVDSADDAIGVIASEDALVVLESVVVKTERDRKPRRRATEIIMTADYGVFELDDLKGAPLTYDASAPSTTV